MQVSSISCSVLFFFCFFLSFFLLLSVAFTIKYTVEKIDPHTQFKRTLGTLRDENETLASRMSFNVFPSPFKNLEK